MTQLESHKKPKQTRKVKNAENCKGGEPRTPVLSNLTSSAKPNTDYPNPNKGGKMLKKVLFFILLTVLPAALWGYPGTCGFKDTVVITDADIVGARTLTADTLYVLVGHVFVEDGEILTVNKGTVIWGTLGGSVWGPTETNPGALIIARGGKAYMQGTAKEPIIMTCDGDNPCDPYDIPFGTRELWGGLIILGKAQLCPSNPELEIEGIPSGEVRAKFGGNDDADNSGIYQYISIRHGGHEIGEANEINGLTMGAVGSGTIIDHIEVFNNKDDAFEWFGGTVPTKYLVAAYGADDCFDYDDGYKAKGQFWLGVFDSLTGDKSGEHDGYTVPEDCQPYAIPTIYNATYIGVGEGPGHATGKNKGVFHIRDNAGGHYHNSIFTQGSKDAIFEIEDVDDGSDPNFVDSEQRLRVGDLSFNYNMWYDLGDWDGTLPSVMPEGADQGFVLNYFNGAFGPSPFTGPTNSFAIDPLVKSYSWSDASFDLDPRLDPTSPAIGGTMSPYSDPWFTAVNYKGAFGPYDNDTLSNLWIRGWTHLWERAMTPFICGDMNYDDKVNALDVTFLINFLYKNGARAWPRQAMDVNNSGGDPNALDVTKLINYLYKGQTINCAL
jgi:hypothetical protein